MIRLAWLLAALPVFVGTYAYLIYPAVLWLVAKKPGPPRSDLESWPMVSIVIPAYNEESKIGGAIDAILAQDYPIERRQILILSDASSDRTDEIVRSYADRGVELLRMPTRGGKTAAENASCALLRGDIVVNSDSSIRFHRGTVRALVRAMADPGVGVASGRDVSVAALDASANVTEAGYVGYEMWVRGLETRCGGIIGASGSGYAIRRNLHEIHIPDDLSRDFSAALTARAQGYSAVSVDDALCVVPRTSSLQSEYRRKVRTISRGMATLYYQRRLLNPARYGLFAWKLASHKITRWLLPLSAIPGVIGLAMLASENLLAKIAMAGVLLVGFLAWLGMVWPSNRKAPRLVSIASFGVAANVAVIQAWGRSTKRHHDHIWEPTRR